MDWSNRELRKSYDLGESLMKNRSARGSWIDEERDRHEARVDLNDVVTGRKSSMRGRSRRKKRVWRSLESGEVMSDDAWLEKSRVTPEQKRRFNEAARGYEHESHAGTEVTRTRRARRRFVSSVIMVTVGSLGMLAVSLLVNAAYGGFTVDWSPAMIIAMCLVLVIAVPLTWLFITSGHKKTNAMSWVGSIFIVLTVALAVWSGSLFVTQIVSG